MSGSQVILLASQLLDSTRGFNSAIALAPSPKNPSGLLTAETIERLKLSPDLVVLGACETGRGRVSSDEIMTGLFRFPIVAGSPSPIVSL